MAHCIAADKYTRIGNRKRVTILVMPHVGTVFPFALPNDRCATLMQFSSSRITTISVKLLTIPSLTYAHAPSAHIGMPSPLPFPTAIIMQFLSSRITPISVTLLKILIAKKGKENGSYNWPCASSTCRSHSTSFFVLQWQLYCTNVVFIKHNRNQKC